MIEPLRKLAQLFGIAGALDTHEDATHWKYYREVETVRLATPAGLAAFEELLAPLRTGYGDALTLRLLTSGLPEFELSKTRPHDSLDNLKAAVDAGSALTLDVVIDKAALAVHRKLTDAAVTTRLFLFPEALVRWLSLPLTELDTQLFKDVPGGGKLVVLVESHDILLDGAFLCVAGGKSMGQWRKPAVPPPAEPETLLQLARAATNRVDFNLHRLTPLHLLVQVVQGADDDPVVGTLYAQLVLCSTVYLAQRSTRVDATWTCTFAADRQETDVRLGPVSPLQSQQWEAARTLAELVRWAYDTDRRDDRFIVLQRTVVDALQNNDAGTNGTEIVRLAGELSKRVHWGWEAFIRGELRKYLEQVKALEETVSATAKDYNEQVGTLATTLIANMLAAVGVILGSFLAALFKSPFEAWAFRFGLIVYVAYLLVFPMAVGLTATWQRFRRSRDTFAARKASFAVRLREEPVREITASILGRSESWFGRWYAATVAVYTAVAIALIAAIVCVPPLIERWRGEPAEFALTGAFRNEPVKGWVTIRGQHLDPQRDVVVTLGRSTFTNAAQPPTLQVRGTSALVFTPPADDLPAKVVTVWQGAAGPKSVPLQ